MRESSQPSRQQLSSRTRLRVPPSRSLFNSDPCTLLATGIVPPPAPAASPASPWCTWSLLATRQAPLPSSSSASVAPVATLLKPSATSPVMPCSAFWIILRIVLDHDLQPHMSPKWKPYEATRTTGSSTMHQNNLDVNLSF